MNLHLSYKFSVKNTAINLLLCSLNYVLSTGFQRRHSLWSLRKESRENPLKGFSLVAFGNFCQHKSYCPSRHERQTKLNTFKKDLKTVYYYVVIIFCIFSVFKPKSSVNLKKSRLISEITCTFADICYNGNNN